jgi:hypothetical protein
MPPEPHRGDRWIELCSEMALSDNRPLGRNPQIWREESHGRRESLFDPCGALGRICQHDTTTPFDALTRR